MKKKNLSFLLISIVATLVGCTSTNYTQDPGNGTEGNFRVAKEVNKFTKDCPKYFIPDNVVQPPPPLAPIIYNDGAVAWTPSGLVGEQLQVDDKENYIKRLNNATVTNQTSYSQYQLISGGGFPGGYHLPILSRRSRNIKLDMYVMH